jgi:hypothetical protein
LIGMKCPGCSEWLDMRDQVKFPPGFKLRPHWHLEAVRTVVILFGALYYANGEQWDESKLSHSPPARSSPNSRGFPTTRGQETAR